MEFPARKQKNKQKNFVWLITTEAVKLQEFYMEVLQ